MINIRQKNLALKSVLLLISLLLSISELILNTVFNKHQIPQVYSSNDLKNQGLNTELSVKRYDVNYESYKKKSGKYEIIAIGDSFTNGGNVEWNQTYPFQLFQMLNQKIPVTNMGICEDTTQGSYTRLKNYFSSDEGSKSTIPIVVVLVGAADIFYDFDVKNFHESFEGIFTPGSIKKDEIVFKLEEDLSFIEKLKFYKMLKFVFFYSKEKLVNAFKPSLTDDPLSKILDECFINQDTNRNTCLSSKYESINKTIINGFDINIFRKLIQIVIFKNNVSNSGRESQIVSDLLFTIKFFPKILAIPDSIYNLVNYTTLQSKYSLDEDIMPILKQLLTENKVFYELAVYDNFSSASYIIEALGKWKKNSNRIYEIQLEYYKNIISLVKENNGEVVFLTYPLAYKKINEQIGKIKSIKDVHVIDLDAIFKEKLSSGEKIQSIIGDWEHCTPKGYELIASEVQNKIMEIIQNKEVKK